MKFSLCLVEYSSRSSSSSISSYDSLDNKRKRLERLWPNGSSTGGCFAWTDLFFVHAFSTRFHWTVKRKEAAPFFFIFFFFFHFGFCSVPRNISSSRGLSSYSRPANLGIYLDTPCRRKRGGTRLNSFYWFRF